MTETAFPLSELLDTAAALCADRQHRHDDRFRAGVIALVARLALGEIADTDRAEYVVALAVDPGSFAAPQTAQGTRL